ncbi:hypothetical protein ACFW1A_02700 [Kitasatospora sp. NPDC058965]|uniref:hypothetical protein n=1 Tax=Kitasatospora sp. NPDC058965 TaxID=3346682 RepID=UPI0036BF1ABA
MPLFTGRLALLLIPVVLLTTWRRTVLSPLPAPALLPPGSPPDSVLSLARGRRLGLY